MKLVWVNLFLSPLWFLLASGLFQWAGGITHMFDTRLPHHLQAQGPAVFLIGLCFVGLFFFWSAHKEHFKLFSTGWHTNNNIVLEIAGGVAMGLVMAILYFAFVAPHQITLQNYFGDYVESGATAGILVKQPITYFIQNVFVAPFLSESLFRNYAIRQLRPHFNLTSRILITSAAFGLLFCMAGFWFMLMTAVLVGIPFAYVAEKRNSIIWTFAAHTTLNILEFTYFAI